MISTGSSKLTVRSNVAPSAYAPSVQPIDLTLTVPPITPPCKPDSAIKISGLASVLSFPEAARPGANAQPPSFVTMSFRAPLFPDALPSSE